ncbi:hypothetical protein [Vibrio sp. D431a]|uniref:hypothetical protein n=1 Tax=Vibrio sp. D431a TaxID=2837388 RepID=UPI0025521D14|nr:hypothetical protein [Vibrio sp. D431a]MDK9793815.1 hypothetical protein [Vibrio sp. D431a]
MISFKRGQKLKLSAICLSVFTATSANAYWTATSLDGAAQIPLIQLQADYALAAAEITAGLNTGTQQIVSSTSSGAMEISKGIYSSSNQATQEYMQIQNIQSKSMMEFQAEQNARRIRDGMSPIPGMRKEMVTESRKLLQRPDLRNANMTDIIQYAKSNVDGQSISVMSDVPMKMKDGKPVCDANQCGQQVPFFPSAILAHYAEMCDANKRAQIEREESAISNTQTKLESAAKVNAVINSTAGGDAVASRIKEVREVTCTPEDKAIGLCGAEIDEAQFIQDMLNNKIVPNGDTSASNFYSPADVGGDGYIDKTDPKIEDLISLSKHENLDRTGVEGLEGLPPITETYRSEAQLRAAVGFTDNIISADIVHNQNKSDKSQGSSAAFQQAFLSRNASLSMARSSFDTSVSDRRGQVLSEKVDLTSPQGEKPFKEREDGAAKLDKLRYEIDENLDMFSPENIEKLGSMNEKAMISESVKQMVLANKMLFDEMVRLEKQELLMATLLAQEVNSPDNIKYMQDKGGK